MASLYRTLLRIGCPGHGMRQEEYLEAMKTASPAFVLFLASLPFAAEVGNIPQSQVASMETRIDSRNYQFFGFGPAWLSNTGEEQGIAYHLAYGISREVVPHAAIRAMVQSDFQPQKGAGIAGASLGALGFLTTSDVSPYLGADLGWGTAWGAGVTPQLSWGLSAGVQLFRTSTTQMGAELRYYSLFDKTREGTPGGLSLQLGLYY
jgi:hypothetical protein